MKKTVKSAIGALLVLCLLVCYKVFNVHIGVRAGNYAQDKELATAAVERFHREMDSGQFQIIYQEASPLFQNVVSQPTLLLAMAQTEQKFGHVVRAVQVAANAFPGGEVRFVYNTKFQNGDATELFTWHSDGQKAALVMYKIQPGTVKPSTHSTHKL